MMVLRICSSEHPQVALKRKPTMREQMLVGRMIAEPSLFSEGMTKMLAYMGDSNSAPIVYEKHDPTAKKNSENAPIPLLLAVALMSKLNMSKEDAWTTPVGQAVWYLTVFGILEGAETKIVTTEAEAKMNDEAAILKKAESEALAKLKGYNGR
jgi:hypothetical protein